ncbi:hypothetical protein [Hydrogenovibrio marinus]|uniref:Uncharacterized protein n=1 Tax=Hydrogenovibrio marinus TaxID=28885 RepID=A0A066ZMV5_HYDMR|nr:hypothetical protein [Hydrogenovibrio marinus]KDN94837.1 hypothetical protein EI16_00540 [Hydrogenovibrio marinus]BBN59296.1 hypothetical protein HVMH_0890 [Hydrogenovibrio marinus]
MPDETLTQGPLRPLPSEQPKIPAFPATYWVHRRALAYASLAFGAIYAIACLLVYHFTTVKDFPFVGVSVILYLFLLVPIIIYMTGANREDLTKIQGIIEILKK